MKYFSSFYQLPLIFLFLSGLACTENDTAIASPSPSNLLVDIDIFGVNGSNTNGDGSGQIRISASAKFASRYAFQFENNVIIESPTGIMEYTFEKGGLHTYEIKTWAYNSDGASISQTRNISVFKLEDRDENLVFADEFEYSGTPDPDKWHHQTVPPINGGWFNDELQHYTDRLENSYVENGSLFIVAKKEPYTTQGSTKSYTSARLNSKFDFKYGRVEIRAKLPKSAGTWPALWTLGANIDEVGNYHGNRYGSVGWPLCGEIDILEQTGWDKNYTIGHFHWGDLTTTEYQNEGGTLPVTNADTSWHIYSMEWDAEQISLRVDGQLVHRLNNDPNKPFNHSHYLLMNIAVGGNLGGTVPQNFTEDRMEIDWVRVYKSLN